MQLQELVQYLDAKIPKSFQESYDNSGLLVGDPASDITGILVTLDVTESVITEAVEKGCNLIVAHHPLIFKPLKKITQQGYLERTVMQAIKSGVAVYAAHTNLDHVDFGVNARFASKLGLTDVKILAPKNELLKKLVVFVPDTHTNALIQALSAAGAGHIGNYSECSFRVYGTGTFKPSIKAHPVVGEADKLETVEENRLEMIFPAHIEYKLIGVMRKSHPYEEVAYYIQSLDNLWQEVGAGAIGRLEVPLTELELLTLVKKAMHTNTIKHSAFTGKKIQKVALCGGSGSFLLKNAIQAGADVFITADVRYHDFFDAEGKILFADIGHFESEQFTSEIFFEIISEKFPNIAIILSSTKNNPVHYF
jgi:dinuclear metal center YbgI/SA1388 family protein